MNKYLSKRKVQKIVIPVLMCGLFLAGCSQSVPTREMGEESGGTSEAAVSENFALVPETTEENREASEENDAELILARLIRDEGFRDCVWHEADIHSGDTEEVILRKLNQCEHFILKEPASDSSLHSLEDLSYLPNLKSLVIDLSDWDGSIIVDFTPIAGLSRLEKLYIDNHSNEEIDLSFLADMKGISELYLPNCQVKDMAFLKDMTQLERLSLYETKVEDLTVLENLQGLVELALSGNAGARNMEAVGMLTGLQDLGLQNCGIGDIGFLSELTELRSVNLNHNFISDLAPLAGLTKLERLGLAENQIRDISPLASLTDLYDLALDSNEISDISALSGMIHLNQAGLSDNRISDLSPLAGKKELMYAAVFGNPCANLEPVWEVPLLSCKSYEATEEKIKYAEAWIEKQHPDVTAYTCIDFVEGDLNQDGRQDIAFVIDGTFGDKKFDDVYVDTRRLYVLLQQKDGSMQEVSELPYVNGADTGGMRGDPYLGISMGDGYLILKEGWGSSTGVSVMQIYCYRDGKLEQTKSISVGDSHFSDGYDVTVTDIENDTWYTYVIAMDDFRMVRVDLANSAYPYHKAFPDMNLYDGSYSIYDKKRDTNITAAEALDHLRNVIAGNGKKADLPYAAWQKTGYEQLKGVELPDYYYTIPGTEENADEETDNAYQETAWEGDFIYYDGLTVRDGQLYHVICYTMKKEKVVYLLHDDTREIQEE